MGATVAPLAFILNDKQFEKLTEWRNHIRALYGEIGPEEFVFRPTGIGDCVLVKNKKLKIEIDLTDTSEW